MVQEEVAAGRTWVGKCQLEVDVSSGWRKSGCSGCDVHHAGVGVGLGSSGISPSPDSSGM